jgi:hypothetical protein
MAVTNSYLTSVEEWRQLQIRWAELDGAASELEEMQKSILAEITNQWREGKESIAGAEAKARASQQYIAHIKRMVAARTTANIAKATADAKKMGFEAWRTVESTKRAEMGMTR